MGPDVDVGSQLRVTVDRAATERHHTLGYALIRDGEIVISDKAAFDSAGPGISPGRTMVHELMHIAEGRNERLLRASVDFYDEMTASDPLISSSRFAWGKGREDKLVSDQYYAGSQPFSHARLGSQAAASVESRAGWRGGRDRGDDAGNGHTLRLPT